MNFLIADTFQTALAKLDNQSQKAAKMTAFDLQMDPSGKGKSVHRINNTIDKGFWSVRASQDIRLIIHKISDRIILCYVDHHDAAYAWAERRVLEIHPNTRALQIVEMEEKVVIEEKFVKPKSLEDPVAYGFREKIKPLALCENEDLLNFGVPELWLERLRNADTDELLDLADHLPQEAQEAVLALAVGETPPIPAIEHKLQDAALHRDAQRRFRVVEGREALEAALDYPWDKWTVFLHPSQQEIVDRTFGGPARVGGSAGTGKTVVALHRAKHLSELPGAKILLTTFSRPLAASLKRKLAILGGDEKRTVPSINTASFQDAAAELYTLAHGREPYIAKEKDIRSLLTRESEGLDGFTERFVLSEWRDVVDGWQLNERDEYLDVSRKGRRSRISRKQREVLWPVFEKVRATLHRKGMLTASMLFQVVTDRFKGQSDKPYTHTIVDEAQDLGPAELRFLSSVSPGGEDALFFAGDYGQRIFQHPFSWLSLGVDIRGRSSMLKVNYRTSHQIRQAADNLLPRAIRDMDGNEDRRLGTVSLFNGPRPDILKFKSEEEEHRAVSAWIRGHLDSGVPPVEIGVFVRDRSYLPRARSMLVELGLDGETLSGVEEHLTARIALGTMHLAKGLEYRAVAVMACDDEALPLQSRIADVSDEADLDEVYATERHLFYVACTRAREYLCISGVRPVSEFVDGLS